MNSTGARPECNAPFAAMTPPLTPAFAQTFAREGLSPRTAALFRTFVYRHYHRQRRPFPWRETTDPYRVLVSEVMLQQTRVERVLEKYPEFLASFPDLAALAAAPLPAVHSPCGSGRRRSSRPASGR